MPLYTFILDYEGGTCIAQVKSRSLKSAPLLWATTLEEGEVFTYKHGAKCKAELIEAVKNNTPVVFNGLQNAWCMSARIQNKFALINFVLTVETKKTRKTRTV